MANEDKLIKSGQLTLPRIFFLALIGAIIFATVYMGGVWLTIGYFLLTAALCIGLLLVAIDYGVTLDKVDLSGQQAQPASIEAAQQAEGLRSPVLTEAARQRRKGSRATKRRR